MTPHYPTPSELSRQRARLGRHFSLAEVPSHVHGPFDPSDGLGAWPLERLSGIGLQDRDMTNPMRSWPGALAGGRMLKAEMVSDGER